MTTALVSKGLLVTKTWTWRVDNVSMMPTWGVFARLEEKENNENKLSEKSGKKKITENIRKCREWNKWDSGEIEEEI